MSHILAALRGSPFRGNHVIPNELALDVGWFTSFDEVTNGIILLPPLDKATWVIECDSSLKAGGAHSPEKFYTSRYSRAVLQKGYNIAQLEAINLITTLQNLAPPELHKYTIVINTDNMTSQQVLSTGAGRDPVICACARKIWHFAVTNSTDVTIAQKPGKDIFFADALSRMCFDTRARDIALEIIAKSELKAIFASHDHALSNLN